MYLEIQCRDGVESLMNLEEGEFKVPIDCCINKRLCDMQYLAELPWWVNQLKTNLNYGQNSSAKGLQKTKIDKT